MPSLAPLRNSGSPVSKPPRQSTCPLSPLPLGDFPPWLCPPPEGIPPPCPPSPEGIPILPTYPGGDPCPRLPHTGQPVPLPAPEQQAPPPPLPSQGQAACVRAPLIVSVTGAPNPLQMSPIISKSGQHREQPGYKDSKEQTGV